MKHAHCSEEVVFRCFGHHVFGTNQAKIVIISIATSVILSQNGLYCLYTNCELPGSEEEKWLPVKSANVHHISTFYTKQHSTSVTTKIQEKKMVQKVLKYSDILVLAFLELC